MEERRNILTEKGCLMYILLTQLSTSRGYREHHNDFMSAQRSVRNDVLAAKIEMNTVRRLDIRLLAGEV